MRLTNYMITVVVAGAMASGVACTQKAADEAKKDANAALDATKAGADKVIDAAKTAGDKTAAVAQQAAGKATDAAGTATAAVTDGWITTKIRAKFKDETILKGSSIRIATRNHAVTLTGTASTSEARTRAEAIAAGTNGVVRVTNHVTVK